MKQRALIGLDIAKSIFQLRSADSRSTLEFIVPRRAYVY